ncbi:50S ribosomal protein L6 [Candidatus Methylacidithermus pantelleriae]|uniref:Large ribosomal subunit protein uL6 n=1 Tax=Candidatus Methylacidithermus pantelleriae TaxID=2744239 RepID=A0A8J2BQF6_9BACT|nr:50S ribosomal protein L6 [Candidatus Methylacidithermus pantelleriae]CAF0698880.1 50S ribosomal subunit protein L6 [Candidatus Methylacidithermus pantelleriae]
MSRIGRKPIPIPQGVRVVVEGKKVQVVGPKGELAHELPPFLEARVEDGSLRLENHGQEREHKAFYGLHRSLLANAVQGVFQGFRKELEIQGIGFRASLQGRKLELNLGFSHPISFPIPDGIQVTVREGTQIVIEGIDKQRVGEVAASLRRLYPPEPYKGKGIRYVGEVIRRKEGKTAQSK